jgi:flavin reductase (DIM6/NTAB) family NADH-FMN oxidoreductase RutF
MDAAPALDPLHVAAPPERFFGYYPGTVAVVTTAHAGRRTVMAAGWHAALSSEPPLYGVAVGPERFTHELLVASGAFAVHFLPFERAAAVAGVGTRSGRDLDKFVHFDLATRPGAALDLPILQDAYLAYECRLTARHAVGDHDWVVGEVVALHHRPEAFDERRMLDPERVRPFVYYGRSRYQPFGDAPAAEHRAEG